MNERAVWFEFRAELDEHSLKETANTNASQQSFWNYVRSRVDLGSTDYDAEVTEIITDWKHGRQVMRK